MKQSQQANSYLHKDFNEIKKKNNIRQLLTLIHARTGSD